MKTTVNKVMGIGRATKSGVGLAARLTAVLGTAGTALLSIPVVATIVQF